MYTLAFVRAQLSFHAADGDGLFRVQAYIAHHRSGDVDQGAEVTGFAPILLHRGGVSPAADCAAVVAGSSHMDDRRAKILDEEPVVRSCKPGG